MKTKSLLTTVLSFSYLGLVKSLAAPEPQGISCCALGYDDDTPLSTCIYWDLYCGGWANCASTAAAKSNCPFCLEYPSDLWCNKEGKTPDDTLNSKRNVDETVQPRNIDDTTYKQVIEGAGYSLDGEAPTQATVDKRSIDEPQSDIERVVEIRSGELGKRQDCLAIQIGCLNCLENAAGATDILACYFIWHNACIACGGICTC